MESKYQKIRSLLRSIQDINNQLPKQALQIFNQSKKQLAKQFNKHQQNKNEDPRQANRDNRFSQRKVLPISAPSELEQVNHLGNGFCYFSNQIDRDQQFLREKQQLEFIVGQSNKQIVRLREQNQNLLMRLRMKEEMLNNVSKEQTKKFNNLCLTKIVQSDYKIQGSKTAEMPFSYLHKELLYFFQQLKQALKADISASFEEKQNQRWLNILAKPIQQFNLQQSLKESQNSNSEQVELFKVLKQKIKHLKRTLCCKFQAYQKDLQCQIQKLESNVSSNQSSMNLTFKSKDLRSTWSESKIEQQISEVYQFNNIPVSNKAIILEGLEESIEIYEKSSTESFEQVHLQVHLFHQSAIFAARQKQQP